MKGRLPASINRKHLAENGIVEDAYVIESEVNHVHQDEKVDMVDVLAGQQRSGQRIRI